MRLLPSQFLHFQASRTLGKMVESSFVLKVLHRSENFLAVDKNFDIVMNDDDPERFSLAKLLKRELPELYNHKFAVSALQLSSVTVTSQ